MAIKVDLLPTERKKFGFDIVIAVVVILIALAACAYYMYGTSLQQKADELSQQVTVKQSELDKLQKKKQEIDNIRKENDNLKAQISTVKTLRYDPIRYRNLLDEISSSLPDNMWVSNITIDPTKNTLTMTGVAAEQPGVKPIESISGFMKGVDRSKYFESATISSTTRGTTNVGDNTYTSYSWTIEMTYNPKKAVENVPDAGISAEKGPGASLDSSAKGRS